MQKMSDSFRDALWCSVNTYSDRLVSKQVGARTGTHWDGSKHSGMRSGIQCTKPSQPTIARYSVCKRHVVFQFRRPLVLDRIGKYSINIAKRTKAQVILVPVFLFFALFFVCFVFCFNNIFLVEIRFIIYPTSGILLRPRTARSLTCKRCSPCLC